MPALNLATRLGLAGHRRTVWCAVFVGPALVLYSVIIVYPLVTALGYSLYEWQGLQRGGFTGLSNFAILFTREPFNEQLGQALLHNVMFFGGTMVVENVLGLLLAVLLTSRRRAKRFFQVVYTTPYLLSPIIVGYIWLLMLSPIYSPYNALLEAVGLGSWAHPWLGDPDTSLYAVILINAWQWVGFPILIFSAALAGIPAEVQEAAKVDGAGFWRSLFSITIPLLVPAIGVVTVLTFIGTMNAFDLMFAIGGATGAPAGSLDVVGLLFYRLAFGGGTDGIGISSALAVMLFALTFGIAILMERALRRREVSLS